MFSPVSKPPAHFFESDKQCPEFGFVSHLPVFIGNWRDSCEARCLTTHLVI